MRAWLAACLLAVSLFSATAEAATALLVFEGADGALVLEAAALDDVVPQVHAGNWMVLFRMDPVDAEAFAALTGAHVGRELKVSVCGETIAAPVVRERIAGGTGLLPAASQADAIRLTEILRGERPCLGEP